MYSLPLFYRQNRRTISLDTRSTSPTSNSFRHLDTSYIPCSKLSDLNTTE